MAIGTSLLTSSGNVADQTSYTTASVTPPGDELILLSVECSRTSAEPATPSISGNGLTWVLVNSSYYKTSGTARLKVFLFRAMGASPSADAITIDFGGVTHTGCRWDVVAVSGVTTSGTNGSGAIAQSANNNGTIANGATLDLTLAAFGDTDNRPYAVYGLNTSNANAIGTKTNWTELSEDNHSTPAECLATHWRSDATDTAPAGTNNSGASLTMGGVGVELVAAGGAAVTGSGTGAFGGLGSASGVRGTSGTATGSFGGLGTATGRRGVSGTAAQNFGGLGSATGRVGHLGAATGAFGGLGQATGRRGVLGSATGLFGGFGTASGIVQGAKTGSGTGQFGGLGTATGRRGVHGQATASFGGLGLASGLAGHLGVGVGAFGGLGVASGRRGVFGSGVGTFGGLGSAVGTVGPVLPPSLRLGDVVAVSDRQGSVTPARAGALASDREGETRWQ